MVGEGEPEEQPPDVVDKLIKALRDNRTKIRALAEAGGEFTIHVFEEKASIGIACSLRLDMMMATISLSFSNMKQTGGY